MKNSSTPCIIYLEVIKGQLRPDDCASDICAIYSCELSSTAIEDSSFSILMIVYVSQRRKNHEHQCQHFQCTHIIVPPTAYFRRSSSVYPLYSVQLYPLILTYREIEYNIIHFLSHQISLSQMDTGPGLFFRSPSPDLCCKILRGSQ